MSFSKRKKPKFKVGQVVFNKQHDAFYKISRVEFYQGKILYYFHNRVWHALQSELRAQTDRERSR